MEDCRGCTVGASDDQPRFHRSECFAGHAEQRVAHSSYDDPMGNQWISVSSGSHASSQWMVGRSHWGQESLHFLFHCIHWRVTATRLCRFSYGIDFIPGNPGHGWWFACSIGANDGSPWRRPTCSARDGPYGDACLDWADTRPRSRRHDPATCQLAMDILHQSPDWCPCHGACRVDTPQGCSRSKATNTRPERACAAISRTHSPAAQS